MNEILLDELIAGERSNCGYARMPFLALAESRDSFEVVKQSVAMMRFDGFDVHLLSRFECEQALGTALSHKIRGGSITVDDRAINPVNYHRLVADVAVRGGAGVCEKTALISLVAEASGWRVETSRGTIWSEHVILAVNDRVPTFVPALEGLFSTEIHRVERSQPASVQLGATWALNELSLYGRQESTGGLLVGGPLFVSQEPVTRRYSLSSGLRLMPELTEIPIADHWEADISTTPDVNPLVGNWPLCSNLWLLAGFGGHGLPFSMVLPKLLAQEVMGIVDVDIPRMLRPERFLR
jgi:glycine/D-amino acid oxidase-like deaminating enzyme